MFCTYFVVQTSCNASLKQFSFVVSEETERILFIIVVVVVIVVVTVVIVIAIVVAVAVVAVVMNQTVKGTVCVCEREHV